MLQAYRALGRCVFPAVLAYESVTFRLSKDERRERGQGVGSFPLLANGSLWFHGVSVGETASALAIIRASARELVAPHEAIVITTSSPHSARLLRSRIPDIRRQCPGTVVVSQLLPLDMAGSVHRFLDHAKPRAGIFIESDYWPCVLTEARARGVHLALVDGRLGEKTMQRWQLLAPSLAKATYGAFDMVTSNTVADASRLQMLGAPKAYVCTSLKFASGCPVPDKPQWLARVSVAVSGRAVWIGASSHLGEESALVEAHRRLREHPGLSDALLILAPRDPSRAAAVARAAEEQIRGDESIVATRSQHGNDIPRRASVYVVDTLGDLKHLYAVASVAFIGNSLTRNGRGHNLVEAARYGVPILHGPNLGPYRAMKEQILSGSLQSTPLHDYLHEVRSPAEIARAAQRFLLHPASIASHQDALRNRVDDLGSRALRETTAVLQASLPAAHSASLGSHERSSKRMSQASQVMP